MTGSLLGRGMLVGLGAGVLTFVVAFFFGEPSIQSAIDFEGRLAALAGEPAQADMVSRDLQSTVGLLVGCAFMGLSVGGIFALTFAYCFGRIGDLSPRVTALVLAAAGFATIIFVPFMKYPPNPPAVGSAETIDERTLLYVVMIAISIAAAIAARRVGAATVPRLGTWNAAILGLFVFVTLVGTVALVLPGMDATPKGFPADVLYDFRLASLGVNFTMWVAIGLGFGTVAERLLASDAPRVRGGLPAA